MSSSSTTWTGVGRGLLGVCACRHATRLARAARRLPRRLRLVACAVTHRQEWGSARSAYALPLSPLPLHTRPSPRPWSRRLLLTSSLPHSPPPPLRRAWCSPQPNETFDHLQDDLQTRLSKSSVSEICVKSSPIPVRPAGACSSWHPKPSQALE
eukprot:scaffold174480_cov31-Tisochrysis_lutea.AAC.2